MIGKKKKSGRDHPLVLLDPEKNEIMTCNLTEIVIPEDIVIRLSIRYFDDEEPCEIHRSAVRKRFLMEILSKLEEKPEVAIAELDPDCQACFPENVKFLRVIC